MRSLLGESLFGALIGGAAGGAAGAITQSPEGFFGGMIAGAAIGAGAGSLNFAEKAAAARFANSKTPMVTTGNKIRPKSVPRRNVDYSKDLSVDSGTGHWTTKSGEWSPRYSPAAGRKDSTGPAVNHTWGGSDMSLDPTKNAMVLYRPPGTANAANSISETSTKTSNFLSSNIAKEAMLGAGVGAGLGAAGSLLRGGNIIEGAMWGAGFGAAGGAGGSAMGGKFKGNYGAKEGRKVLPGGINIDSNSIGFARHGALGGIAGGLFGHTKRKKNHNRLNTNGWSNGTHPMYFR